MSNTNENLYGLSKDIYLSKPAVENWAKYNNIDDYLINNRLKLLDDIDQNGTLTLESPDWMTSVSNKVEAFVVFKEKSYVLLLKKQPKENKNYNKIWEAINCTAPKSLKVKSKNNKIFEDNYSLDQNLISQLESSKIDNILENIWISEHALDRFNERTENTFTDIEQLKELLNSSKVSKSPDWASASSKSNYCLILDLNDDEIVFPLLKSVSAKYNTDLVITTCLSKSWVLQDLSSLDNEGKFKYIEYSSKLKQNLKNFQQEIANSDLIISYQLDNKKIIGPFLVTSMGLIKLYPINNSNNPGKRWLAQKINIKF